MKWLLVIFFLGEYEHEFLLGEYEFERIPFVTEKECMAAAADFVELNPNFDWVDGPREVAGERLLVIRSTVECIGADEDQTLFELLRSQRGDP